MLPTSHAVVFGIADCHLDNTARWAESVVALRPADGRLVWAVRPPNVHSKCDLDFGATAND